MSRIHWKEGKVLCVETQNNVWVVAQMAKEPYLTFFKLFGSLDELRDSRIVLDPDQILFCCAITRFFLQRSRIEKLDVSPAILERTRSRWISLRPPARVITVFNGTEYEKRFAMDVHARLVELNIWLAPDQEETTIIPRIAPDDETTIDSHELSNLRGARDLNARLFLCAQLGRNVDPLRDAAFGRDIPLSYKPWFDATFPGC